MKEGDSNEEVIFGNPYIVYGAGEKLYAPRLFLFSRIFYKLLYRKELENHGNNE